MDLRNHFFLNETERKGMLLVFITAIVSGFSIFINSYGVKEFDSSIFTFMKNVVVSIFLLALILALGSFAELKKLNKKQWMQLALIGLLGGSIPFLMFFKGLQMTTGTASAFIHKTLFVFVAAFAIVFLKEKPNKDFFVGALLIILGTFLMIRPNFAFSAGNFLIFGAVLFWAAENTYSKHIVTKISGTLVAFGRMFFGCIFILVFLLFSGKISLIGQLKASHLLWIGISSLFLLVYVLTFYNGIKTVKISTAASILSIGAPITALLSWVFAGKALVPMQAIGILLIFLGIVSVFWLSRIVALLRMAGAKNHGRN